MTLIETCNSVQVLCATEYGNDNTLLPLIHIASLSLSRSWESTRWSRRALYSFPPVKVIDRRRRLQTRAPRLQPRTPGCIRVGVVAPTPGYANGCGIGPRDVPILSGTISLLCDSKNIISILFYLSLYLRYRYPRISLRLGGLSNYNYLDIIKKLII